MKNLKIYRLKQLGIQWIIFLFTSFQSLLGQDHWLQVQNYNNKTQFDVFGESYFKMPVNFFSSKKFNANKIENEIILPNEKGEEEAFEIVPTPLLSKNLIEKYPNLRTYRGISKTRPNVRLSLSTQYGGINAWLQFEHGPDYFIQPVKGEKKLHYTYLKTKKDSSTSLFCKTEIGLSRNKIKQNKSKKQSTSESIRTFRIAISATGEFTNFWGDNDNSNGSNTEDALAAVVSTLNRINVIFERDLNVRLELVSDASLLYSDPNTDPYTGNFSTELQTTLDQELGDGAYDVGHLFDYGEPNGDAGCIGCVCLSGEKAQGYSTHPFRDIYGGTFRNDYFDLDYAGHEIGHQFGAYHTYSFETEGTGFNVEPGSGSTIMGYAGITGEDDLQQHGDPYFHYYSIQNILEYVNTISCGTSESVPLDTFSINAGKDYKIPIGTAYELSIDSLSGNSGESFNYCWEQLDSAEITTSNFGPNNQTGALTRSLIPKVNSKRMIPNLDRVLSNELTEQNPRIFDDWETVPLVGRTINWGLTVRKNTLAYSQVAQDKIELTSIANAGPFTLDSQNRFGTIIKGGSLEEILWSVAGTDQSPISVSSVNILLSKDGGSTFPILLAESVPNNGSALVIIPNGIDTTNARIKIKPVSNIFFAINSTPFTIQSRDLVLKLNPLIKENCGENSMQFDFNIEKEENFDSNFTLQISSLASGVEVEYSKSTYDSSDTAGSFTLNGLSSLEPGDYNFTLEARYNNITESFPFILKQRSDTYNELNLLEPINEQVDVTLSPILLWEKGTNVDRTRVQLSKNPSFEPLILDSLVTASELKTQKLSPSTEYYWRIQNQNNCGDSDFSESYTFQTNSTTCSSYKSIDLPKDLIDATDNEEGETYSVININFDAPILDLNILVDLTHTWLEDLSLYLIAPNGDRYLLTNGQGGSNDDYTQTIFDQEAPLNINDGSAPYTGIYRPTQDFSLLYGTSSRGEWKLLVLDQFKNDTGSLLEFGIDFCLEGVIELNSDNDTFIDINDNCPLITNEDQSDIDSNGIGDVCDIFSEQNISIIKKDTSCPDNENGSLRFDARAQFTYRAEIIGPLGYQRDLIFTKNGKTIENLAPGEYDICVYSNRFPDFQYCFTTQINSPEELGVTSIYNPSKQTVSLDLSGGSKYEILINGETYLVTDKNSAEFPLNKKLNNIKVKTNKICQGIFEDWINLEYQAKVFPNPFIEKINLILPKEQVADVYLFSASGELLLRREKVSEIDGTHTISMGSFPRGWYVLQIDYGIHSETHKLLKR